MAPQHWNDGQKIEQHFGVLKIYFFLCALISLQDCNLTLLNLEICGLAFEQMPFEQMPFEQMPIEQMPFEQMEFE